MRIYTTVQGDMWDNISYKLYGTCNYKNVLMEANPAYRTIHTFSSGTMLSVPDLDQSVKPNPVPPWKVVSA